MFTHGEQILWHRWQSAGRDSHGSPTGTLADPIPVENVGFAPESTEESGGKQVVSTAKLYCNPPIGYGSRDQFTVRGVRYAVDGDSQGGWRNPFTGTQFGQEIQLKRVTGGGGGR